MAYTNPAIQAAIKFQANAPKGDEKKTGVVLPPVGPCIAVFVGYVEIGVHSYAWSDGKMKHPNKARLTFELTGPRYPHKLSADGQSRPQTIVIEENIDGGKDSTWADLVGKLRQACDGTSHIAELLGQHYLVTINHGDPLKKPWASFKTGKSYDIKPPVAVDMETGKTKKYALPAHGKIKCFIWSHPRKEDWDDLFIAGEYGGVSNNKTQNDIRKASNYKGSPIDLLLTVPDEEEGDPFAVHDSTALDDDGERKPLFDDPWDDLA